MVGGKWMPVIVEGMCVSYVRRHDLDTLSEGGCLSLFGLKQAHILEFVSMLRS